MTLDETLALQRLLSGTPTPQRNCSVAKPHKQHHSATPTHTAVEQRSGVNTATDWRHNGTVSALRGHSGTVTPGAPRRVTTASQGNFGGVTEPGSGGGGTTAASRRQGGSRRPSGVRATIQRHFGVGMLQIRHNSFKALSQRAAQRHSSTAASQRRGSGDTSTESHFRGDVAATHSSTHGGTNTSPQRHSGERGSVSATQRFRSSQRVLRCVTAIT